MTSDRPAPGWHGWDDYARFYDWENARTVGRRDVAFWCRLAGERPGPVLELGCGTGRVLLPLARVAGRVVGLDRSVPMLRRARTRLRRLPPGSRPDLVRGDITTLPFAPGTFGLVVAPYGVLQSILTDRALRVTLTGLASVVRPGGTLGLELVPDIPAWQEYTQRVTLRGRLNGKALELRESVRQDRGRHLTYFRQEFVEGTGAARRVHAFRLTFRTLTIPGLVRRLRGAGFEVDALLGGYAGEPLGPLADAWLVLATRRRPRAAR